MAEYRLSRSTSLAAIQTRLLSGKELITLPIYKRYVDCVLPFEKGNECQHSHDVVIGRARCRFLHTLNFKVYYEHFFPEEK